MAHAVQQENVVARALSWFAGKVDAVLRVFAGWAARIDAIQEREEAHEAEEATERSLGIRPRWRWTNLLVHDKEGRISVLTWEFWRCMVVCFCVCAWIGHWLEIPYCTFMSQFGIVDPDYSVWHEPWFTPYWVYGIGAVAMTFVLEPFKDAIASRSKTKAGALAEVFVYATVIAAVLETVIGLIINQPNELGVYPYWDNSVLPLNILGQGWLVNDLVIAVVAVVYLYLIYPAVEWALEKMPAWLSNVVCLALLGLVIWAGVATYLL